MEMDPNSLKRLKTFMEFVQRAQKEGIKLTFVSTPTEHGDNINANATIDGKRESIGILFWDVSLLQNHGLADTLDDDEIAMGLNITDGLVEDADKILAFVDTELAKFDS